MFYLINELRKTAICIEKNQNFAISHCKNDFFNYVTHPNSYQNEKTIYPATTL